MQQKKYLIHATAISPASLFSQPAQTCRFDRSLLLYVSRRAVRILLFALELCFLALVLTISIHHSTCSVQNRSHRASAKDLPTDFEQLFGNSFSDNGTAWDHLLPINSLDWNYESTRELGHGREGYANLATDNKTRRTLVVKQFAHGPGVQRNHVPLAIRKALGISLEQTLKWPSEIPATLLLLHLKLNISANGGSPLVPCFGYTCVSTSPSYWPMPRQVWQMITPFMSHGNLQDFAGHLHSNKTLMTTRQLDLRYRARLERLLRTIAVLGKHNICHDDIKATNIFVSRDESWHLGDFGQLREKSHSYHDSSVWLNGNQWSDCRLNDVRRAIQTYLLFLHNATPEQHQAQFDHDLFACQEPWSRLYWAFWDNPVLGDEAATLSRAFFPALLPTLPSPRNRIPRLSWLLRRLLGDRLVLALAAQRQLQCRLANWWHRWGVGAWLIASLKQHAV